MAVYFEFNVAVADALISVTVTGSVSVTVIGSLIDAGVPQEEVVEGETAAREEDEVIEEEDEVIEEEEAAAEAEEAPLGADNDSDPASETQLPTQKGLYT